MADDNPANSRVPRLCQNAVEDIDLRRQQIDRLVTLLGEPSDRAAAWVSFCYPWHYPWLAAILRL